MQYREGKGAPSNWKPNKKLVEDHLIRRFEEYPGEWILAEEYYGMDITNY